jgi:DNA-binding CsgD family transcriptional regulator
MIRDAAEIAMGVGSAEEFRYSALDSLTRAVGADAGSHCSVGEDPSGISAALIGTVAPEAKVVDLLERGLTNREIASLLGLSVNTVRNRVASAFKRVGASRRAELMYLLRSGN